MKPYRDDNSRLCGSLQFRDKDGRTEEKIAILDEEKCLLRFFDPSCAKNEALWEKPDKEIATGLITKIEKKARNSDEEPYCFEIQMVDLEKHFLEANSDEEMNEWIQHLHRVAVDPTRRQEGKIRKSIKDSFPREDKENKNKETEGREQDQSPGHISYETKIIGGVVVRRPVSKKNDSDSDSLSSIGSHTSSNRSMSGGAGKYRILKEGYLVKKGAVVRNWKKRYFKLDLMSLSYYEKDTDKDAIRSIATNDILHVRHSPSSESNKDFLFEVQTATRTFLIQADNTEEMEDWIKHLKNATQSFQGRSYSGPT